MEKEKGLGQPLGFVQNSLLKSNIHFKMMYPSEVADAWSGNKNNSNYNNDSKGSDSANSNMRNRNVKEAGRENEDRKSMDGKCCVTGCLNDVMSSNRKGISISTMKPMFREYIQKRFGFSDGYNELSSSSLFSHQKLNGIESNDRRICMDHLKMIPCRCAICGHGGYKITDRKVHFIHFDKLTSKQIKYLADRGVTNDNNIADGVDASNSNRKQCIEYCWCTKDMELSFENDNPYSTLTGNSNINNNYERESTMSTLSQETPSKTGSRPSSTPPIHLHSSNNSANRKYPNLVSKTTGAFSSSTPSPSLISNPSDIKDQKKKKKHLFEHVEQLNISSNSQPPSTKKNAKSGSKNRIPGMNRIKELEEILNDLERRSSQINKGIFIADGEEEDNNDNDEDAEEELRKYFDGSMTIDDEETNNRLVLSNWNLESMKPTDADHIDAVARKLIDSDFVNLTEIPCEETCIEIVKRMNKLASDTIKAKIAERKSKTPASDTKSELSSQLEISRPSSSSAGAAITSIDAATTSTLSQFDSNNAVIADADSGKISTDADINKEGKLNCIKQEEEKEQKQYENLNLTTAAENDDLKMFEYHYHAFSGRHGNGLNLCFIYRKSAIIGKLQAPLLGSRFDQSPILTVPLTDPETKRVFNLRLRRGYIVRCTLRATHRSCIFVGLHLKSLRGNTFSHYKRMAQARIVRSALQPFVDAFEDIVIMGDLNSAETDSSISSLSDKEASHYGENYKSADNFDDKNDDDIANGEIITRSEDYARQPIQEIPRQYELLVPAAQRTFIVETLRTLDARSPRFTLANIHSDSAPTWRRGYTNHENENGDNSNIISSSSSSPSKPKLSSQLDHILFRFLDQDSVFQSILMQNKAVRYKHKYQKQNAKMVIEKQESFSDDDANNSEIDYEHDDSAFILDSVPPAFPATLDFTSDRNIEFHDELSDHALVQATITFNKVAMYSNRRKW